MLHIQSDLSEQFMLCIHVQYEAAPPQILAFYILPPGIKFVNEGLRRYVRTYEMKTLSINRRGNRNSVQRKEGRRLNRDGWMHVAMVITFDSHMCHSRPK